MYGLVTTHAWYLLHSKESKNINPSNGKAASFQAGDEFNFTKKKAGNVICDTFYTYYIDVILM